jgi:hypothetical protein
MLERAGLPVDTVVAKVGEQVGVDAVDLISSGKVDLVVNTPRGRGPRADGMHIRRAAIVHGVACVTTVAAAVASRGGHCRGESQRARKCGRCRSITAQAQLRLEVLIMAGTTAIVDLDVEVGPVRLPNPDRSRRRERSARRGARGRCAIPLARARDGEVGRRCLRQKGNPPLRVSEVPGGGMLNSVGLPGPGVDAWIADDLPRSTPAAHDVIASIWGRTRRERRSAARPLKNVGRPPGRGRGQPLVPERRGARRCVRALRGKHAQRERRSWSTPSVRHTPLFAKLSPNVTDIVAIATAAREGGATGFHLESTR